MIKFGLYIVFVGGVVLACSNSSGSNNASTPPVDGAKLYKQYCVACHGLYGDMGASGAANLAKSTLPLPERIKVITNGRNTMTPFGKILDAKKVKAVAQYTMTLKHK